MKYSHEYVNKLYSMAKRNCTVPFNFICVTEREKHLDKNITIKKLPDTGLHGWWNKVYLFKPGFLDGVNFYLDLDVVIHDNIDSFLTYGKEDDFVACLDFGQPEQWFNSSVMRFNSDVHGHIWETFNKNTSKYTRRFHGDQNFITSIMRDKPGTEIYPNEWAWSYKWGHGRGNIRRGKGYAPVPGSKIAVFHGRPNPEQVKDSWVLENWRYDEGK